MNTAVQYRKSIINYLKTNGFNFRQEQQLNGDSYITFVLNKGCDSCPDGCLEANIIFESSDRCYLYVYYTEKGQNIIKNGSREQVESLRVILNHISSHLDFNGNLTLTETDDITVISYIDPALTGIEQLFDIIDSYRSLLNSLSLYLFAPFSNVPLQDVLYALHGKFSEFSYDTQDDILADTSANIDFN